MMIKVIDQIGMVNELWMTAHLKLVSVQLGENSNWQVPKSLKNGEDKQYGNSGIGSKL